MKRVTPACFRFLEGCGYEYKLCTCDERSCVSRSEQNFACVRPVAFTAAGWSDPMVPSQPLITEQVMAALGETGPFIMIGSMDDGDQRIYKYAQKHRDRVVALVPVVFGPSGEFRLYADFYHQTDAVMIQRAQDELDQRMTSGNLINFFGVQFGFMSLFVPEDIHYVPANRVQESKFLNLFTEKQWTTNVNYIRLERNDPVGSGVASATVWATDVQTATQVPVLGFTLAQTPAQLAQLCVDAQVALNSQDCAYIAWTYNTTRAFQLQVIARNPSKSRLFECTNCTAANGNSFLVNQNENIPWFVNTMVAAVRDL